MGRAITELQHSQISLLTSIKDLQGSSITDLQQSMVALMGSATALQGSANTLQGSANTLQASNNSLIGSSQTDLQISTNSILVINRGSSTALFGSVNTLLASQPTLIGSSNTLLSSVNALLGSLRDQMYLPQNNYYTAVGTTSEFSEHHFGFTCRSVMLGVTSGSLGLVQYKFGGSTGTIQGEIYAGESKTFDNRQSSTIAVGCVSNSDPTIRIEAWG